MKKHISFFLCFVMVFTLLPKSFASDTKLDTYVQNVGKYLYETVLNPSVGSIGGEWAILGLARSGCDISPNYFEEYYKRVENHVDECGGILHKRKYTEYSRVITALTAIGKNPENVGGYNLLAPLADFEKTVFQGINGPCWALIALDCGNYEIPKNDGAAVAATREMYVNYILEKQLPCGGWSLSGDDAGVDITAMALTALSRYSDNIKVKEATEKALDFLSNMQNERGGFSDSSFENAESSAQVTVALSALKIPLDDPRFLKNGNSVIDNLLSYYIAGEGFKHTYDDAHSNAMATEQCFYALVAALRFSEGKSGLYEMENLKRHPDVKKTRILYPQKSFDDIKGNIYENAVKKLAERNIINGKAENFFDPDSSMTRAEFASVITKSMGLKNKADTVFDDVKKEDWFFECVGTAYFYEIVKGTDLKKFTPNGIITREEAFVMIKRCAKLCGAKTEICDEEKRTASAITRDYNETSSWAQDALAFCVLNKILPAGSQNARPKDAVTRGEVADMVYNMLFEENLL